MAFFLSALRSMPVCTDRVKKRKARRKKNDRLKAAKIAAQQAKV
jgi:hypothetical protein